MNLFHNCIDVSGAERMGEVLKVNNNTLKELDIGYNRIKNNGFKKVINGIVENNNSSLKKLGVKYSFIKDKEFEEEELDLVKMLRLKKLNLKIIH